jgi:serine/threonine protein kinase
VRLLDWGVAHISSEADPLRGMIAGTLTYVAPEQVLGRPITTAADIYSLGVLAYHVLLGGPPFTAPAGKDLDLIGMHLRLPPPTPASRWPEIPDALAAVLVAMLAKDPADRPTLAAIAAVLEATRNPPAPAPKRRSRSWLAAIPAVPPIDVLGRAAPILLGARHPVLRATVAVLAAIAGVASMFSA